MFQKLFFFQNLTVALKTADQNIIYLEGDLHMYLELKFTLNE